MTANPADRRGPRIVALAAGVLLLGCAAALLWSACGALDGRQWIGFALLAVLGLEETIAGLRGRRSLLSRIGPLP